MRPCYLSCCNLLFPRPNAQALVWREGPKISPNSQRASRAKRVSSTETHWGTSPRGPGGLERLCAPVRGRRERGEARGTVSQFRQPNCTDSTQITKDTPSGRTRTTGQRSRENPSSQWATQENVCALTCPTKTRKSALGKAGWTLHLNYSVIKTSNSQGRQEKIHAFTHKVARLELVSQDCCKGRAW